MNHIAWALIGMAGYSTTTLLVKLAARTGQIGVHAVLAIATTVVAISAWAMAYASGQLSSRLLTELTPATLYALATGAALTIAVSSLFRALALGPASVVVPIYGMFILGGAVLGITFLGEAFTFQKTVGLVLAIIGVVLVAS